MTTLAPTAAISPREIDLDSVEIIIKVSERCNIACTYCYFFFGGDESYRSRPARISGDVVEDIVRFVRHGSRDLGLKHIVLTFHGGEPMMMPPDKFRSLCQRLSDSVTPPTRLHMQMQTNGMLVNDRWIDLLEEFHIGVGVSIDGPQEVHDRQRIDHRGQGTHARVVAGIGMLREARRRGRIPYVGGIAVIDPTQDPRELLPYFVEDLGFDSFDFIPPFGALDCPPKEVGKYFCRLFDAWIALGKPDLKISLIQAVLNKLRGYSSFYLPCGPDPIRYRVLRISSDGSLYPDEHLPPGDWDIPHVAETSMADFLQGPYYRLVDSLHLTPPSECVSCCWRQVCHGGHPWNRHSPLGDLRRPSSLCEGLKMFYAHVVKYLLHTGTPMEVFLQRLALEPA